ncbi:MAG: NAD-dependent epimerase/dehydratase family protein [Anaerolineae bacterium]|nr:NAD-dependent epimerase/dehydratase family protein [Anaerolineae bacterium]
MSRVILVTGGAGYIGSRLIRDLATDPVLGDHVIRIYDNLQRETYNTLLDLPPEGRYQFVEGDILDNAGVERALQDVWAVVHMAAIVRTPLSFGKPGWLEQVNHWGTANLADAAAAAGVAYFVYVSSASVYGPIDAVGGKPFKENDICRPVGLYAESKLRAERHIQTVGEQSKMRVASLRLGPVFGLAPAVRFDAVANRLAYLASVHRPLTVYGEGTQVRPLLHVRDASSAIRFALASETEMVDGVYNVVGENASVLDVVAALRAQRPDLEVRYTEQDVLTHLSYSIDGSRLNGLGWYPRVSLEAGLAELLDRMQAFEPFLPDDEAALLG